jgi:hypothetical protein
MRLGVVIVLVLAFAPSALAADATRMTGVDAQHTGAVPDSPLQPPLRLRWSLDLGRYTWQALVDGGRLHTLEQAPGQDSFVVARDLGDGHVLWSRTYPFASGGARNIATDGGRVFVLNVHDGGDGDKVLRVEALDPVSGALQWAREILTQQGSSSSLTVDGGAIYLLGDDYSSTAYALRQSDGSTIWRTPDLTSGMSTPVVDGSRVYVSLSGGNTFALDRASGAVAWSSTTPISGGGGWDPTLWGGRLYGNDGFVLDPGSGAKVGEWHTGPLSVAGDVGIESTSDGVRAFGPSYETTRWTMPHQARFIAGDHAYGGDYAAMEAIYSARLSDGESDWCHAFNGETIGGYHRPPQPLAAGNGVLIAEAGVRLGAFENGGTGSTGCVPTDEGPRLEAAAAGPEYPPPSSSPGIALKVGRRNLLLGQRTNLTGRVSGVAITPDTRVAIDLDEYPYSDRGWHRAARSPVNPDGTFAFKFAPRRNSRLRARLVGSDLRSPALEVLADFPFRLRVKDRGGPHPRVRYTVYAFRNARARRKVIHAYVADGETGAWRRVDSRRATRRRRASVTWVLRFPRGRLGREDHWFVCWREPTSDGFGEPLPVDRRCGDRRIPRRIFGG